MSRTAPGSSRCRVVCGTPVLAYRTGDGMSDAWTVLWTNDRCRELQRFGEEGEPLHILFGGAHLSQPSFSSFKLQPGDWVYPLRVSGGVLYVLGRMRVREIV